jgi:2-polyprenyl-6-methoxyphenol hydroxylase-like FAD-dependent oxidoreductase
VSDVVRCCVVGGGPAGMMLGFLLARAGVEVTVLEKHADFLRDFRGDTIHPSTLSILNELGLLQEFLTLPHREVHELRMQLGNAVIPIGDFSHLSAPCRFVALMPQWDFLNFLARQGARRPTFRLLMQAEATELLRDGERVTGVRMSTPDGQRELRADLVVAADGRSSVLRQQAGLEVEALGAPMDVLWFRVSREPSDPAGVLGRFDAGQIFIALDRGDYWQCGYVIGKGSADEVQRRGLDAFRDGVARVAPFPRERANEILDWDQVKLLTVQVDRLRRWYLPGLLCIGDAAHAMSPIGGVGINLAIQDAVAAANALATPLRAGQIRLDDLARVQRRREFPARATQWVQVQLQNRIVTPVLRSAETPAPPLPLRLLERFPLLRRIPAYLIGVGVRPEHVTTPDVQAT